MHAPHVIPQEITKFHIQLMHILAAITILSPAIIGFFYLFLHVLGLNFGYVTPQNIPKVHKNPHNFCPSITLSN
jgi:hypothetical protein